MHLRGTERAAFVVLATRWWKHFWLLLRSLVSVTLPVQLVAQKCPNPKYLFKYLRMRYLFYLKFRRMFSKILKLKQPFPGVRRRESWAILHFDQSQNFQNWFLDHRKEASDVYKQIHILISSIDAFRAEPQTKKSTKRFHIFIEHAWMFHGLNFQNKTLDAISCSDFQRNLRIICFFWNGSWIWNKKNLFGQTISNARQN